LKGPTTKVTITSSNEEGEGLKALIAGGSKEGTHNSKVQEEKEYGKKKGRHTKSRKGKKGRKRGQLGKETYG